MSAVFYLFVVDVIYIATYFGDKKEIANLKMQLASVQSENKILKEKIKDSQTPAFIEKFARENFMLAKKGETVIYFAAKEKKNTVKPVTEEKNPGIFEKIWLKLLHLFQN